jgi:hypothetical protein
VVAGVDRNDRAQSRARGEFAGYGAVNQRIQIDGDDRRDSVQSDILTKSQKRRNRELSNTLEACCGYAWLKAISQRIRRIEVEDVN